jgi:hypothetical protein
MWSVAFSSYVESEFSKKQLGNILSRQLELAAVRSTPGGISREVDTFLRVYTTSIKNEAASEESLDCPLTDLNLIQHLVEENLYRLNIGAKSSLPVEIFGYALLHFLAQYIQNRRTLAIDEALFQNGSPGQAFKLDENALIEYLEQLETRTGGKIRLNDTAGLRQIYLEEDTIQDYAQIAQHLLQQYYAY